MFKNKDEIRNKVRDALKSENPDSYADAMAEMITGIQAEFQADLDAYRSTQDAAILAKRGVKTLTAEEKKFFDGVIEAVKTGKAFNAVTGLEKGIPTTIMQDLVSQIQAEFPLLDEIDMQLTTASTTVLFVSSAGAKAAWGAFGSETKKEITAAIKAQDISHNKLTAYVPISRDFIEEGAPWVAAFATAILKESIGLALEDGAVNGTGLNMPTGMTRKLDNFQTGTGYAEKTATKVTSFSPAEYGALAARVAKTEAGRPRRFSQLILVCNTADYFSKIMPASTVLTANGIYARDMFPIPTKVVIADSVASGKAILGVGKAYKLGVGVGGRNGRVENSDHAEFVEDNRVYKQVVYANGSPEDATAFEYLDISELQPLALNTVNVSVESGSADQGGA